MRHREPNLLPASRITSLSLDYGTDDQECGENAVEISERGMRLKSRWRFEIGTQLALSFVWPERGLGHRRFTAEGIVVWCEPCGGRPAAFESTLLFLELPDDLKHDLRELSHLLGTPE
jgi:hypothetical protein